MKHASSTSGKPNWLTWSFKEPYKKVIALHHEMRRRGIERVLDLGCGAGRHTVYLSQKGFEVYALDISLEGVELTIQWLADNDLHADLHLAEITALPFPDCFFDVILSVSVLHHNTMSTIQSAIAEIKRVLRTGGLFFASECAKGDYQDGRGEKVENGTFLAPEDADQPGVPHHFFSEHEIGFLLQDFQVIQLEKSEHEFLDRHGCNAVTIRWDILAERL